MAPGVDDAPAAAAQVFGQRLAEAGRYAELLCGPGVERGLLGPREGVRIWDRHLLNSAALAELIPYGSRVVDVGSGAGLPGIPLCLARPDLRVTLVEPMRRRCDFLRECLDGLALQDVHIRRARAAELAGEITGDVVVARAVARLDRLLAEAIPLCRRGGVLLAVKGAKVDEELAEIGVEPTEGAQAPPVGRAGGGVSGVEVREVGHGLVEPPVVVVRVTRTG